MENFNLRKKILFFATFAAVIIFLLILIPFIEDLVAENISGFRMFLNNLFSRLFGETEGKMADTATALLIQIFRIIKIILWMSLIVSIIRFINQLIFSTALRSNEISSLLRNIISIILYIVSFFVIFNSQYPNVDLAALFTTSSIL